MCGIFGLVQRAPIEGAHLTAMSSLLRHRGPDDEGFLSWSGDTATPLGGADTPTTLADTDVSYVPRAVLVPTDRIESGGVVLGHRRLSIIDLSPRGHQPMSRDDRYWISYNGEIYNYVELRQELSALGERFVSTSDTEVILAAFSRWGLDCFQRFNGMWAIAILDTKTQQLVLSRDRFGIKPLYLLHANGSFAFASEIKAFRALPSFRARMHRERVLDFLIWNVSEHGRETMFDGVEQLLPGHLATVNLCALWQTGTVNRGDVKIRQWYSLPGASVAVRSAADVRDALEDAVRLRLRADVPVGSCLSGGIDSSSIVCLMSRLLEQSDGAHRVRTFTARSDSKGFDESAFARLVVESANTESHFVTPNPDRLFDDLDSLVWHQDEPFLTTSIFAQRCVFDAARRAGVIVMLDGQGADELLAGYPGYFGAWLAGLARSRQVRRWFDEVAAIRRNAGIGFARLAGYSTVYSMPALAPLLGRFDNRAYSDRSWIRPSNHDAFASDPIASNGGRASSIAEMSRAQITSTHLPMLLHWEDRNSMSFSVEARVPFLDYRVVELCLQLPDEAKIGGGVPKGILRSSMRGIVPDAVLDRRDKMGFVTAERVWMSHGSPARFRALLTDAVTRVDHMLDPQIVTQFDQMVAGRRRFDSRYWRAVCLGVWARTFELG